LAPVNRHLRTECRRLAVTAGQVIALLAAHAAGGEPAPPSLTLAIDRIQAHGFPGIQCFVTVTDDRGQPVSGLAAQNFGVSENGAPTIGFSLRPTLPGEERVAVVLAVDCSGSMRGEPLASAKAGADDFTHRLAGSDLLAVLSFADTVDRSAELSTDRAMAERALAAMEAGGNTALYDALSTATKMAAGPPADRRAVVVLTDGKDNASRSSVTQCMEAAARDGVAVYTVGLGSEIDAPLLRRIASGTGGQSYVGLSPDDLVGLYRRIAHELRTQYVLTYSAPEDEPNRAWRTVRISVTYGGARATDQRQFLAAQSPRTRTVPTTRVAGSAVAILAALLLFDAMLFVFWLRRRRRGSRSGHGSTETVAAHPGNRSREMQGRADKGDIALGGSVVLDDMPE
jgi:VWFA-related protein